MYLVYDVDGFFLGVATDAIEGMISDNTLVKIPKRLYFDDDEDGFVFPKVETQHR